MNGGGQTRDGSPVMRNGRRPAVWHKCEPMPDVPGGWALLCLVGHELRDRREFTPTAGEDSEAVNARAHAAGWAWSVANGGDPRPDPAAPSPIDGWVQGMVKAMNRQAPTAVMRATLLGICLTGSLLGCSRQVEVVDTVEQAKQREEAAKHFDDMKYTDLSEPLGAKPAKDAPDASESAPSQPEKQQDTK